MQKTLPAPVLYILLSLADEDRHGYAIMRDIRERTGGRVTMGLGALYTSLQRALRDGYIREAPGTTAPPITGRTRRAYRLTADGRRAAERELARLDNVLRIARRANLRPATDG